jgi:putative spermidine/putrescine transport system substrate-binding protein
MPAPLARTNELSVLSWAGGWGRALEREVSRPFTERTGIRVRHVPHVGLALPQALLAAWQDGTRPPIDVAWTNVSAALRATHAGRCEPLDEHAVPNLNALAPRARAEGLAGWPFASVYVVYYVLAYRESACPDGPPESWNALLDARHRGKVALYPGGHGFYPVAQVMGGGALADIPAEMSPCWAYLAKLKPQIGVLDYSISMGEQLRRGSLDLAFRALTNALAFREEGLDVGWAAPCEGVPDTVDTLWIPRGVPGESLPAARAYIDFALSREVQERWCDALGAMPFHVDAKVPRLITDHHNLPHGPDDFTGILHVSESLKLGREPDWARRFEEL